MSVVRIGTRASALALTQTGHVADDLVRAGLVVDTVRVRTEGDRLTGSLVSLGGTGVFVTALRDALLDGRCDVAVHSLKDLPTAAAPGLTIAAVPVRQDPRDALCARDSLTLRALPAGARVGTGSPRRAAQLLAARPDLDVVDIRGNVDTRLGRVAGSGHGPGDLDAVVLARAGLARLGRLDAVTEALDGDVMLPAPGQGALAVEVRTADLADPTTAFAAALAALDHRPTRLAVAAERALLARLEAGCAAPVGCRAGLVTPAGGPTIESPQVESPHVESPQVESLHVEAVVARTDGSATLRRELTVTSAGARLDEERAILAGTDLADLLLTAGAADLAPLGPTA